MHHNFRELEIWKESKDLSIQVYKITRNFPREEVYGITSQICRASVSIPSNIAEGAGRNSNKDFSRFINIALGSAFELETQLIIALELEYISKEDFENLINNLQMIQRKLSGFNKYLQK
ncbi:four helix bundle protein [Wenyingzhuangia fucanilytica]|uniref:Four helix bundle protein n=1 Tax=Wenyingzhuangia fucanilytica TaxID=1790137 RepID=A0A1B1Y637_9FLAO|nr:four helix bundle protein [Wenyingzhuangia fucanilytica]ANW96198.1 four helix bundle protein [Wenyingzhuangia fucanilytica]